MAAPPSLEFRPGREGKGAPGGEAVPERRQALCSDEGSPQSQGFPAKAILIPDSLVAPAQAVVPPCPRDPPPPTGLRRSGVIICLEQGRRPYREDAGSGRAGEDPGAFAPRLVRFLRMFARSVRRYGIAWSLPRFWVLKRAYFDRRPVMKGILVHACEGAGRNAGLSSMR